METLKKRSSDPGILHTDAGENVAIKAADDLYSEGAAGGTATSTLTGVAGMAWVIGGYFATCSADPAAGNVSIAATGMTTRNYKHTSKGPGPVKFPGRIVCPTGQTVTMAFATGGGSGVPTLEPYAWLEPA